MCSVPYINMISMIKKILFVLMALISIYLKPYLSFLILLLFFLEYIYFIDYVLSIYKHYNNYYKVEVTVVDLSDHTVIWIWCEFLRLQAFNKVYLLFLKNKKVSFLNILKIFFIFIFNIPYRFLKICYYFIFLNKHDFKKGLVVLYYQSFFLLKNCKIEVFNGKVYLNCDTVGKLARALTNLSNGDKHKVFNSLIDLQRAAVNFENYEREFKEPAELKYSQVRDTSGYIIFKDHYAYKEGGSTMHATSNMPRDLTSNQRADVAMPNLITRWAKNPCTIITTNIGRIFTTTKSLWVQICELNSIKYDNMKDFSLNPKELLYMTEKNKIYIDILKSNFNRNFTTNDDLVKVLRVNQYRMALLNATNKDFNHEINAIAKEKENIITH